MKKKLKKVRNTQIIVGIAQISFSLSRLSIKGLDLLAICSGSVGILSFLVASKSQKEIIKNDNN
ncbi:hypothetical protein [Tissierella sp. Yu-01]|uniref:hypothetical protein n=1 Tax=Tissierella sp. Yu-01 TaxID=3035694 RepID=UPI00240E8426|nr:hypothetical protein [Tissierella sp. Yu-01]WFA08988.1 hypothetical protein P3962_00020 [Tissierella sp. Yu-01]